MFYLLKLAIRNVGRNKRRSLLAFVSVAIAITVIVALQGWMVGIMESFVKNATKNETGHIRVASNNFERKYRFYPVSNNIENPDRIISSIEHNPALAPEISMITQRIAFGVLLSNGNSNKSAIALAGDPQKEERLLMLQKSILPGGRYLKDTRDLIMGSTMAKELKYRVGDTVKVMTSGSDYALHLKKFVVVGLFQTGMVALDDMIFQIGIDDARDLLRMGDQAQQIIIVLHDYRGADRIASLIKSSIADTSVSVKSWTKIGETFGTIRVIGKVYDWIFFIIALLGAFIISNIMMMVVMERRKEIGILKSMGVSPNEVLFIFLTEGTILGLIGSLCGGVLGFGIVTLFHFHGIDMSAMMSRINMPLDSVIYPALSVENLIKTICLGTFLAALVSLLPARQAARMNVVDSIKSV